MRLSKFRMLGVFALTALVAGAVALPTRAKAPTKTQNFSPLLIAQSSANAPSADTPSKFGTFLDTASPNSTTTLTIPVTDFTYAYGGVGEPNGSTNTNLFKSLATSEYGVLGGASNSVLTALVPFPLTANALSTFSPNLTSTQLSHLKSATVSFQYVFASNPGDTLTFKVINVTTGQTTYTSQTSATGAQSVQLTLPNTAFPGPGQYAIDYELYKPKATNNDAAGFNNFTLTLVSQ